MPLDEPDPRGEDAGAAGRQPPGAVPGGDDQLQSEAATSTLDEATQAIRQAVAELRMPDSIRAEAAGDAKAFAAQASTQPLLIIAALHLGLHRAGRALREPGAPADHHLDAAVGRPRRADRAATRGAWSSP